ncbi:AP-5 complex subunit zeta-1 [Branchiostoma belcheri]|nr:AP-5 complex subunit zeta-1 [Branchiostoma belcheri]
MADTGGPENDVLCDLGGTLYRPRTVDLTLVSASTLLQRDIESFDIITAEEEVFCHDMCVGGEGEPTNEAGSGDVTAEEPANKQHIKNILEELPNHLSDKDNTLMLQGKDVQRGVDYRKHLLIVTAQMATNDGDPKAVALLESLCNVAHILYLGEEARTPQLILRLSNQIYLHSMLVKEVIGCQTKSITTRKLYGQYWHSLTTHAPIL